MSEIETKERPRVETPSQVIKSLRISSRTLWKLLKSGELESYFEGRGRKITTRSIDAFIERRIAEAKKRA